ncbi:uncharacterized protein LOC133834044 isoform X2 [Humulus lupulus]|nr:uncharacterized protein LOC133834044 isoform X2 [Humulus lupulus]
MDRAKLCEILSSLRAHEREFEDFKRQVAGIRHDVSQLSAQQNTFGIKESGCLELMDNAFSELLKAMHGDDVYFCDFNIVEPTSHKKECMDYDCGVYVMKMLLHEYVGGVFGSSKVDVLQELDFRCISIGPTNVPTEFDRQIIGAIILTSRSNKVRHTLLHKAQQLY